MSFSTEIKQEITYNELKPCCMKAQLAALIQPLSYLNIRDNQINLAFRCENPTVARRIIKLIKNLYKNKTDLSFAQKTNLKKNNVYTITVQGDARILLEDLGLYSSARGFLDHPSYSITAKDCCQRAYIAGCFLAYGSCNSPTKADYHLEVSFGEREDGEYLIRLLKRYGLDGKISSRRNRFVVYLKKADDISDFLRMIGASESLMNFENARISRDFKNSLVRVNNCDIANEIKSQDASRAQVEQMMKIKDHGKYEQLDEKLKNVIDLRLRFPEDSLSELAQQYHNVYGQSLSKSGLKHRLDKIENIAKDL